MNAIQPMNIAPPALPFRVDMLACQLAPSSIRMYERDTSRPPTCSLPARQAAPGRDTGVLSHMVRTGDGAEPQHHQPHAQCRQAHYDRGSLAKAT